MRRVGIAPTVHSARVKAHDRHGSAEHGSIAPGFPRGYREITTIGRAKVGRMQAGFQEISPAALGDAGQASLLLLGV